MAGMSELAGFASQFDGIFKFNTSALSGEVSGILTGYSYVLCGAAIIGGAIMLLAGAKLIKFTVFLAAFAMTGWIGFTLWKNVCDFFHIAEKIQAEGILPVIVLMGIVGGCIALRLVCFGIFLLGAAVGCAIGFTLYVAIFSQIHWPSAVPKLVLVFAPYICMAVVGTLFGILAICVKEKIFKFISSILGAFAVVSGVSILLKYWPDTLAIVAPQVKGVGQESWKFWLFVSGFLLLTLVGIIVQLFGKKICKKCKESRENDSHATCASSRRHHEMTAHPYRRMSN